MCMEFRMLHQQANVDAFKTASCGKPYPKPTGTLLTLREAKDTDAIVSAKLVR